jgi:hypothetical protein
MKTFQIIIVFTFICHFLPAQDFNEIFKTSKTIDPADSNKLFFRLENTNFFKNNEYFGILQDGYTIMGTLNNPKLLYYPSSNSKLEAGILLLKYSGKENYAQVYPTFSFQVKICPQVDVLLGSLYSGYNHELIEPIYQEERHFMNHYENGIQIMTHMKRFQSDLWLNWERMIFWGDPYKEEFTVGTSNRIFLTDPESKLKISVPLQGIVSHKGGQIDSSNTSMQSLANLAGGLSAEYKLPGNFLKAAGADAYYVSFNDISPSKEQPYITGYGIFTQGWINSKYIHLYAGYWDGNDMMSPRGEPLFQSVSVKKENVYEPVNQIVFAKIGFKKEVYKDIFIDARFECYYELYDKNFDYSYGLHIIFNRNFFLKKI